MSTEPNPDRRSSGRGGGNFGRRRKFPAKIPKIFGRRLPEKAAIFGRFGGGRPPANQAAGNKNR
jgi:hypothetical protein